MDEMLLDKIRILYIYIYIFVDLLKMQLWIANQIEHCSTCNYDNSVCILHVWPPNQEPKRRLTFTRVTTIFRVFYSNHHHHPRQQQSSKRMTIDGNSVRCDDWWDWINNWINAGHNQQSIASITINTADSKDNNCVCVCVYLWKCAEWSVV